MSDGTSLAVRNLFYNVPARRNFLKTPATELRHIIETFQALALSRPDIGFTLIHDDAEMHRLPAETGKPPRRSAPASGHCSATSIPVCSSLWENRRVI